MSNIQSSPPGWYPDPYQRYAHRWYDGVRWTDQVAAADGSTGADPEWASPGPGTGAPVTTQTQVPIGQTFAATSTTPAITSPLLIGAAGVGVVLIVLGMFALPWISISSGYFDASIKLSDLTSADDYAGAFFTTKMFWQGGVYAALGLTAIGAAAAAVARGIRIPTLIVSILTLIWLASVTLVSIGEDSGGSFHVEWNGVDSWGSGLWLTWIGIVLALVSTLLPRSARSADV